MRLRFPTAVPAAFTFVGLICALSARASASEVDPASAVRGSLGVSIEDLALSHGAGASVFLLNAGFALLFAALAIASRRANSKASHIPLRATSNFVR
jgi:ABC-type uncharacterized transport system permease subunit